MDFTKFLIDNKKAIIALAKQNANYKNGKVVLSKEEIEEDSCWDNMTKEEDTNHE